MKRYSYNNKIGMYDDDNGDWCRVDDVKCCGNCIYFTDNICLCNSVEVMPNDSVCGVWQPKENI